MKLNTFKSILKESASLGFELPNGKLVPAHFHITEVGEIAKKFIDCGGTIRNEKVVNFQLWEANDYDHRLHPEKLLSIISLSEEKLGVSNKEIEVEYQGDTICKYGLEFNGTYFELIPRTTDCLAKDKCGIPEEKLKVSLSSLSQKDKEANNCTPGSGCC